MLRNYLLKKWITLTVLGFFLHTTILPPQISIATAAPPKKNVELYDLATDRLALIVDVAKQLAATFDRSVYEIGPLAAKLEKDPAAMHAFVRDRIAYRPYRGSLRGAEGTLIDRLGNGLDRSLLLAALLTEAGFVAEIVRSDLDQDLAAKLVARVFEAPPALPKSSKITAQALSSVLNATGLTPDEFKQAYNNFKNETQRNADTFHSRVTAYDDQLHNELEASGIKFRPIDDRETMLADVAEHYWVRYRKAGGKWTDLDASFAEAKPGETFTKALETFKPDKLPESLQHRLRIRVKLRIAELDGSEKDIDLIDETLVSSKLMGRTVRVLNLADGKSGLSIRDFGAINEFQTVLITGDKPVLSRFFSAEGDVYNSIPGSDAGNAERIRKPIESGFTGGMNQLKNLFGNSSVVKPKAKRRLVGQWMTIERLNSRGREAKPEIETVRRDIVAPRVLTSWSPDKPEGNWSSAKIPPEKLKVLLNWSIDLNLVSGGMQTDYFTYLQMHSLASNEEILRASLRKGLSLPVGEVEPPADISNWILLAWQAAVAEHERHLLHERFFETVSFYDKAGLIAEEYQFILRGDKTPVLRSTLDLMRTGTRILSKKGSDAIRFALARGVLHTGLEREMMANHPARQTLPNGKNRHSILNTTTVMEGARKQDIPLAVLSPGEVGIGQLDTLSLSDSVKAEIARSLLDGNVVVVPSRQIVEMPGIQTGWWRIDEHSGETLGILPGGRGMAGIEDAINRLKLFGRGMKIAVYSNIGLVACIYGQSHEPITKWVSNKYPKQTARVTGWGVAKCMILSYAGGFGIYTGVAVSEVLLILAILFYLTPSGFEELRRAGTPSRGGTQPSPSTPVNPPAPDKPPADSTSQGPPIPHPIRDQHPVH